MSTNLRHFVALSKKNWINYKRTPCGNFFELFCPIMLMLTIIIIKGRLGPPELVENLNIKEFRHGLYPAADIVEPTDFTKTPIINPPWVADLE